MKTYSVIVFTTTTTISLVLELFDLQEVRDYIFDMFPEVINFLIL